MIHEMVQTLIPAISILEMAACTLPGISPGLPLASSATASVKRLGNRLLSGIDQDGIDEDEKCHDFGRHVLRHPVEIAVAVFRSLIFLVVVDVERSSAWDALDC